jgi:GNAT superfamily N-acetyltransferase
VTSLFDLAVGTRLGYFLLGNEVVSSSLGRVVRNHRCPWIRDANFVIASGGEAEDILPWAESALADSPHVAFKIDPTSISDLEARLVLDGYQGGADLLELILVGPLKATARSAAIRQVSSDDDWTSLARLHRLDNDEVSNRRQAPAWSDHLNDQMMLAKRAKYPKVRYLLASVDEVDCAYVSYWPGLGGVGLVEDLFTHPAYRHRGIATELITVAVDRARADGADAMLIGADPADTPKEMYRALGFRPLCLQRSYWRDRRTRSSRIER